MIKKLITFSGILVIALSFGLVVDVDAAYDDVVFNVDTPTHIHDLTVSAGSQVDEIVVGDTTVTVTLASGSSITFTSADGREMQLNQTSVASNECYGNGTSSLTIPYNATYPTVILSLTGDLCSTAKSGAPTVSGVEVASMNTVTVTMSEKIGYISGKDSDDLLDGTATFAGLTPIAVTTIVDDASTSFTFTFLSGALAGAGVTDTSKLILPAAVLEDVASTAFAGVATGDNQYVTNLASINKLYDFVFAIQPGKNFMSVPYEVSTTLVNSYVDPTSSTTISIQTIGNAGTSFAPATSYSALHGYYILSTAATDVYLRLNKSSSTSGFSRTLSAAGWHLIGIASNDVLDSENTSGAGTNVDMDDDILVSLDPGGTSYHYDIVMDVATIDGDPVADNTNLSDVLGSGTYDNVLGVYKALWDDNDINTKSYAEVTTDQIGIEFNHGEAYFIYINTANAKYTGTPVDTDKLIY